MIIELNNTYKYLLDVKRIIGNYVNVLKDKRIRHNPLFVFPEIEESVNDHVKDVVINSIKNNLGA